MRHVVGRRLVGSATAFALVAAAVLFAGQGADAIGVNGGRIDFGHVERGGEASDSFVVRADDGAAVAVEITVENDPDGALAVTPATARIPSGGMVRVTVTLAVPTDADPGRHQPAVVVAETTSAGGTVAGGAVRVPVTFVVDAIDVAGVYLTGDGLLQARVVNGHPAPRTAELDMSLASPVQAHAAGPVVVDPGASWLVEWTPDWTRVADGAHTLQVIGSATGGPETEPFAATFEVIVSGGDRQVGAMTTGPPTPTTGGGGPGGVAAPATRAETDASTPPRPTGAPTTSTMPPLPAHLNFTNVRSADPDAHTNDPRERTGTHPSTDPSPGGCVLCVLLALAALAAVGYGLTRAFKNHGSKRPPSGAS